MTEAYSASPPPATQSSALRGLLVAQFFGAFNDNAWKLIVALLAIKQVAASAGGASGPELEAATQATTTQAFVIFTLPLMVVSAFAGVFSDRFSKRTVIVVMKAVEVLLMGAGTAALFWNPLGGILPLLVLAAMGAQSALFSPSKYGIIPELLPHHRLSWGNGQIEMWTFIAIIAGTALAGLMLDLSGQTPWLTGLVLMMCSGIGLWASLFIPTVPRARLDGGVRETWKAAIEALRFDRVLKLGIMGAIAFWTLASLVGQDVLIYAKVVLHLSDSLSGLPLAAFGIGVGIGSLLVGKLSAAKVELGYLPLGGTGITASLFALGFGEPQLGGTLIAMGCLGLASGFVVVPLNALIQWRSPADRRGAVIAFANTLVFGGVLLGSLGSGFFSKIGLSASNIFLISGLGSAALTIWALRVLPEMFIRLLLVLFTHTIYRLTITGRDHIPQEGGALLVPNHVSFIDGLLLLSTTDRPIRFLVDQNYYDHRVFQPFAKIMGVIPISSNGSPREILHAIRQAGQSLDQGELVCIFPEGQITRTGNLLPFRSGFTRIVKGRDVPIIPINLDRVWGSIFSFIGGRFLAKWPTRFPYPITLSVGAPLPSTTSAEEVRQAVQELGETAWHLRKLTRRPLHHSFVWSMRKHPFRVVFGDATRPRLSCFEALTGAIALARALRSHWEGQQTVGILLPPSVGGALANMAATLSGRTTVNLNYTVGVQGMESSSNQAGLVTVLTSRVFLEKANLELPMNLTPIWIEEIRNTIDGQARITAMLFGLFAPIRKVERFCGATMHPSIDDIATIIFSSGSTGEPKGVPLSHFNLDSNVEGIAQVLHLDHNDRILGILPFFHSFGYLTTLWFPVIHGAGVIYHPSPMDAGPIGNLIHKHRVTILLTTPTFLQLYLRRCTPEQFGSLRIVLTGAEKLPDRLLIAFEERFGIRPIEGYGVTECAPVIAVNCPDFRASGFFQSASRRGTVGQPLPGVSVRIVDPDTEQPLPVGTPGMLLVKGPNVMSGYLGREDLTAKVIRQGWYITGDIAALDEDGFITITDRLSRFSKIGGEMIPHGRVESALMEAANTETMTLAVTAVPDERKGEQLVVLHTLDESAIPEILEKVTTHGLPNLFIPKRSNFIKVDRLPVLGTGKLDLRTLKQLALAKIKAQLPQ
ncbi:MAG TPA: acyl-[ACP]--phospholipid O-acyltransferase [Nitrospirales bacterium]|nr:acyl-[ACP]--phospholipid O-acyltransferase [Nitrospira sp. MA-1]HNP59213.1 acyl-[ACP]--phospholipid O-acyltransferase [Nitrospirales bacterium]